MVNKENINERAEWVESEYKKWEDRYTIPFASEFNIKTMLELKHQFYNTPDEHTKAKRELIEMMSRLQKDANLKPNLSKTEESASILIASQSRNNIKFYYNLFSIMLKENILSTNIRADGFDGVIKTKDYQIEFLYTYGNDALRGLKFDYILKDF